MQDELSYVIITPHSIRKSRTGGIISRLLSRTGLDLVAARMFAPSAILVREYAAQILEKNDEAHHATLELIHDYVLQNFSPDENGRRTRVMLLVFRGPNAVARVMSTIGHIVHETTRGKTIRDTYGDYIPASDGKPAYFEPAVLSATDAEAVRRDLLLWASHSDVDGGILRDVVPYPSEVKPEQTLVLIKPDNFRFPNARPGGVIDLFSSAGLAIIGMKVHWMSVAEAEQFYGPVREVLKEKLKEPCGVRARMAVEKELGFPLNSEIEHQLGEILGPIHGWHHWESIVQFMAGARPSDCTLPQKNLPGTEQCLAIIYEGPDAVRKIRDVLGPTDPSKAPAGSIRREFGQTTMVNAAHASDSVENARNEMDIIRIHENNLKAVVEKTFHPR